VKIDQDDKRLWPDATEGSNGGLFDFLRTAATWKFRDSHPSMKQGSRVGSEATDIESSSIKQEDETPEESLQVGETIQSDRDLMSCVIPHSQRAPGGFPSTSAYSGAEGGSGIALILVGAVVGLISWVLLTRIQEAEAQQNMEKALSEIIEAASGRLD
jgi:hypothetical protein